jgi:lipoprotein-releasing system permease protein
MARDYRPSRRYNPRRMILSRHIAWRYLRRPTDTLVSAVGLVSILGLVIGVMALVISMALMTGYRTDLQKKLLGGNAEVFVYSIGGPIADTAALLRLVRTTPGVGEASPVLYQSAVVTTESNAVGTEVMLKGIEPARGKSSAMLAKIIGPHGAFETPEGEAGVAVGKYLAAKLGVDVGSSISITVPSDSGGSTFLPRSATFVVTNVYATGFYEFDARWLFIDLRDAERLLNVRNSANLIEVKLAPRAELDDVTAEIARRTEHRYAVSDWRDINKQLFVLLNYQQRALFIIIGLIVFVSTFNIVSTLIMTVHEKRKEIGILASMGAGHWLVRSVFLWYGAMVGVAGTLLGVLLGSGVCWIITRYHLVSFGPEIAEVYFVSSIPFIIQWRDIAIISGFAIFVSFIAAIVPSLRAARLNPVEALRHE